MQPEYFLSLIGINFALMILIWGYIYIPIVKISNTLIQALGKLKREFDVWGNSTFFLDKDFIVFSDKNLKRSWNRYLSFASKGHLNQKYIDIDELFDPDNFLKKNTNTGVSAILPAAFFLISSMLTLLVSTYSDVNNKSTNEMPMVVVSLIAYSLLISILMVISYKSAVYNAKKRLHEFTQWIADVSQTPLGVLQQLGDIRATLNRYHSDQLNLYSKLNKDITLSIIQKLEPFLNSTAKTIEDFINATSIGQQDAMKKLADYFYENTTELYDGQVQKITEATTQMTQIQEKTSNSLKNISEFIESSKSAINIVQDNSKEMTNSYAHYLAQMKDMSLGIDTNLQLMKNMLNYMDTNAKNKDFTIEKLSGFQQELISVSDRSSNLMNEFFADFKDNYSSQLEVMTAVSAKLRDSGDLVEKSYSNFTGTLGNISEFFAALKDGILNVQETSLGMTDSYESNLEQMKSINTTIQSNITSTQDLTEYVNRSLRSNDFNIEKLSEFQHELITVSERSANSMNEFFADFKDHYSSYIIAMKAASADMQKSSELVSDSYSRFTKNLDGEVSNVFLKFEDNLSEISIKFAQSIKDLQEAIDELPDILNGLKSQN